MKTTLLLSLFLMVLSSSVTEAQEAKKYAVKSGYLKLELSGNTIGTKELWWDDYGNKTCEIEKSISTTKIFGVSNQEKKDMLTILVNENYWSVDYITDEAYQGKVMGYQETHDAINSMTESEREATAQQIMESMGGENLGKEQIGKYNCDVYSIMGAKSWTYKGITLKSEAKILGIENKEMYIDFKPESSVAASQFTPPDDISYDNIANEANQYWGDMTDEDDEVSDEDEDESVAVSYPYEKFKQVINSFSPTDYSKIGVNSLDGKYAATYMKGLMGSDGTFMIVAESNKNMIEADFKDYESFTHNGHKCYYGKMDEEEDGTALIVDYANYDMLILLVAIPNKTKNELLKISDMLKF